MPRNRADRALYILPPSSRHQQSPTIFSVSLGEAKQSKQRTRNTRARDTQVGESQGLSQASKGALMMAAAGWWCWPLPAWLGSGVFWFVLLNVVVGAIFALSARAQPQSPSPRRGITRRASSVLLQRLRSFSVFSSPSPSFHTEAATEDSHVTFRGAEDAGTSARAWSPSTPRAPTVSAPATKEQDEEEDSLSMEDVYALVQARRQQPPTTPTEEEAAGSEVDAKAEEFIRGFKDDLRQQRLDSIYNYTQMLKRRAAGGGTTPVAEPDTADQ